MTWIVNNGVALVIGIGGYAFAMWAWRRPRKRLKLSYQTASVRYFDEQETLLPSGAAMTFGGESVARLVKSTVIVWNAGTDVLRGKDIVSNDPLRICFGERARVLSHAVVGTTKKANAVATKAVKGVLNELTLTYDYLNAGDGFVIHAVHDGERKHPRMDGSARGLSEDPKYYGIVELGELLKERARRRQNIGMVILSGGATSACAWMAALAVGWVGLRLPTANSYVLRLGDIGESVRLLFLSTCLFLLAIQGFFFYVSAMRLWRTRRRYPRSLAQYLGRSVSA